MNSLRLKKFLTAFILGTFTISLPMATSEGRIHDPKVKAISSSDLRGGQKVESGREYRASDYEKYYSPSYSSRTPSYSSRYPAYPTYPTTTNIDYYPVEKTISLADSSISGTPIATQAQCVEYLLQNNPNPKLSVSPEEIVAYYYEEAGREGIRADVAFAQALKETGFFRYGGDVVPEQNNFCGLGTTGGGVRGGYFPTAQIGVRAHIQHLLAYSSTRRPTMPLVDPRYDIVRKAYGERILTRWSDLNGRWAVPGNYYGQEIMSMFRAIVGTRA